MKSYRILCIALLLSMMIGPSILLAQSYGSSSQVGLTLYEDKDYRGKSATYSEDIPDLGRQTIGNDKATSLRLSPGCTAILFEDTNYRGRSWEVETDQVAHLGDTPIGNDKLSSIRVDCDGRGGSGGVGGGHDWDGYYGAALSTQTNHYGKTVVVYYDDPDLSNNGGDGEVRSVELAAGCSATLYEGRDYEGRNQKIVRSESDLTRTVLRGRVGSIRVSCNR